MDNKTAAYRQRLAELQQQLDARQAILISKPNDIFYLTGFPQLAPAEREAFLVVLPDTARLFHHSFSPVLPKKSWLDSVPSTELKAVAEFVNGKEIRQLYIDEHTLSVSEHKQLQKHAKSELWPLDHQWLWQLRMVKNAAEITAMKRAGKVAQQVFKAITKQLKPGVTERGAANRILSLMLERGAEKPAFPIIVAFGAGGALPHYQPRNVKLKKETPVLIDLGASVESYCSDMTRSFWFGTKPTKEFAKVEQSVKTAYKKTLDLLKNRSKKLTAKDLDDAARSFLNEQGHGKQFIHTTGHGLGIEIHEPPSLSWKNETTIEPGMTITIEPGVYVPDQFGYRHENTVLVTKSGAQILT